MKSLLIREKLQGLKSINLNFCEDCVDSKKKKISFLKTRSQVKPGKLELVHANVWGPALILSQGRSSYFVTFIDDHSRKI